MIDRLCCINGGWVAGSRVPFPIDPTVRMTDRAVPLPCNQLYCSNCRTPVKHMEGVRATVRLPDNLFALYDAVDPDLWIDVVEINNTHRLYYCRCGWHSAVATKPVGHLDTSDIDHWACAGHPVSG